MADFPIPLSRSEIGYRHLEAVAEFLESLGEDGTIDIGEVELSAAPIAFDLRRALACVPAVPKSVLQ